MSKLSGLLNASHNLRAQLLRLGSARLRITPGLSRGVKASRRPGDSFTTPVFAPQCRISAATAPCLAEAYARCDMPGRAATGERDLIVNSPAFKTRRRPLPILKVLAARRLHVARLFPRPDVCRSYSGDRQLRGIDRMSIVQNTMIALARSASVSRFMRSAGARSALATRFVSGADVEAALSMATRLVERHGIRASLFYLGEYVVERAAIEFNVNRVLAAIDALGRARLDVHVSIDPTAIGFMQDDAFGTANATLIAQRAAGQPSPPGARNSVMLMPAPWLRQYRSSRCPQNGRSGTPPGLARGRSSCNRLSMSNRRGVQGHSSFLLRENRC